ncbi:MAG: carboxylating nicotinate-nucleotide diphosphorylase [Gaiellaceae bacterium]
MNQNVASSLTTAVAPKHEWSTSADVLDAEIERLIEIAISEDLATDDATSEATLPRSAQCQATVINRAPGVVCGLSIVEAVFEACPGHVTTHQLVADGDGVEPNTALIALDGDASCVLAGERTALNFLGHLSGIATLTRQYVRAVEGTDATVLDTRKTTPGLRHVEKYAVRCGGGTNHRLGLYDAILIKDNHLLLTGTLEDAVARARASSDLEITVEVESLTQLKAALRAGADRILLDNMGPELLREAVALAERRVPLEASGGINLTTAAEIAGTGVDYISVGTLTHSAPALDVSLEVRV